jgi:4-aminobutyrate aminotransferase-like enzyme
MDAAIAAESLYYPVSKKKMARGESVYLFDEDGDVYLDRASATCKLRIGYSLPIVLLAIREWLDGVIHLTSSLQGDPVTAQANGLPAVAPRNMCKTHSKACSSSSANHGASQAAIPPAPPRKLAYQSGFHTTNVLGSSGNLCIPTCAKGCPSPYRPRGPDLTCGFTSMWRRIRCDSRPWLSRALSGR